MEFSRAWLPTWRNECGQDMIEYSLMAGFVAVAAGAILPNLGGTISTIFSKIVCAIGLV